METFIASVLVAALGGAYAAYRGGAFERETHIVLEYERGVKFVGGHSAVTLEPGRHRINPTVEAIQIVDMRPLPFLFEVLPCKDALNHELSISFSGEMFVLDPRRVVTLVQSDFDEGTARIAHATRAQVSLLIVPDADDNTQAAVKNVLRATLHDALAEIGMDVSNFELNELWVAPVSETHRMFS